MEDSFDENAEEERAWCAGRNRGIEQALASYRPIPGFIVNPHPGRLVSMLQAEWLREKGRPFSASLATDAPPGSNEPDPSGVVDHTSGNACEMVDMCVRAESVSLDNMMCLFMRETCFNEYIALHFIM